jgi:FixJ family two-component response regulator
VNASDCIVYVVDDDQSVREALSSLVRSVGFRVETFDSAVSFLKYRRSDAPSCLVLDVRMQGLSGLDLQRALAEDADQIPIIFITGHGDIPMTVRAMKAGAVEFLAKPFSDDNLLEAIQQALEQDLHPRRARAELAEVHKKYDDLTSREREVLVGIVKGKRNKEIAFDLGITEETIKVHRHRLMQKMDAKSLPDLVRMVEKLQLFGSGG